MSEKKQRKNPEEELKQGLIESYIHLNGRIGVLIEIRCETDFVAKTEEFKKLAHELCLQIAAMNPLFLQPEDISERFLIKERETYQEQLKNSEKPKKMIVETLFHLPPRPTSESSAIDEILEGKLKKYKKEVCLISQPWVKDETKTIKELIDEYIVKVGEKIAIKRFIRYEL